VLDVGQGISGPYCAKIMAQMGAEVIKVEPPEGEEARSMGPFPGGQPHPEKSGLFLALTPTKMASTLTSIQLTGRKRSGSWQQPPI